MQCGLCALLGHNGDVIASRAFRWILTRLPGVLSRRARSAPSGPIRARTRVALGGGKAARGTALCTSGDLDAKCRQQFCLGPPVLRRHEHRSRPRHDWSLQDDGAAPAGGGAATPGVVAGARHARLAERGPSLWDGTHITLVRHRRSAARLRRAALEARRRRARKAVRGQARDRRAAARGERVPHELGAGRAGSARASSSRPICERAAGALGATTNSPRGRARAQASAKGTSTAPSRATARRARPACRR